MDTVKYEVFEQWKKERDEAVASLDINRFKAFLKKWQEMGIYPVEDLPNDGVLEVSMYKMATCITSVPTHKRQIAREWLTRKGFTDRIVKNENRPEYEVLEYGGENGYSGRLIHNLEEDVCSLTGYHNAEECFHSYNSNVRNLAELKEFVDRLPAFLDMLGRK